MNTRTLSISIALIVLLILATGFLLYSRSSQEAVNNAPIISKEEAERSAVETVVKAFGSKMQLVPLSGTSGIASSSISAHYSALVSAALLNTWLAAPQSAPGRVVSSPWPDRIDITSTRKDIDGSYVVEGKVIEITSVELQNGGVANSYPVRLRLRNVSDTWLISDFEKTASTTLSS